MQMPDSLPNNREGNADPTRAPEGALRGLSETAAGRLRGAGPASSWNPPDCGDIDMCIAADGTWFYCGSPIGRLRLVKLFASVLRKEADRYVLVTPVEKVGIRVHDAPFLAVEMRVEDEADELRLVFRTNVEDFVRVGCRASASVRARRCRGSKAVREGAGRPLGAGQASAAL